MTERRAGLLPDAPSIPAHIRVGNPPQRLRANWASKNRVSLIVAHR
jgi:hypothetical protein